MAEDNIDCSAGSVTFGAAPPNSKVPEVTLTPVGPGANIVAQITGVTNTGFTFKCSQLQSSPTTVSVNGSAYSIKGSDLGLTGADGNGDGVGTLKITGTATANGTATSSSFNLLSVGAAPAGTKVHWVAMAH
jgi:hypothetical protein